MRITWTLEIDKVTHKSFLQGMCHEVRIKIYPIRGELVHISLFHEHGMLNANFKSVGECVDFAEHNLIF